MKRNKRKLIIAILATILGTGCTLSFAVNFTKGDRITIKTNDGVIMGENNGVVKNYTMGGGTTRTKNSTDSKKNNSSYNPTYITNKNPIIYSDKKKLEGIFVENYTYSMDDVSFETLFGEDKIEVIFGPDHPNGFRVMVRLDEYAYNLNMNIKDESGIVIDEYGELVEGSKIQISPYDFDEDGINELIVCITDELGSGGICSVFSYTHVDDYTKVNAFYPELNAFIQKSIYLNGNSLQVPVGSANVISEEYKYVDERFMKIAKE